MSLGARLRRDFSPYEIAVMGQVLCYALGFAMLVLIGTGRIGAGLIFGLVVVVLGLWFAELSRCPKCTKDPMKRSKQGVHWFALYVYPKYRFRLWPERECSECGFQLDTPPPLHD